MKKKIIIVVSIIVILFLGAGLFVGNFFYEMALSRYGNRDTVFNASHNQISEVMADAIVNMDVPEIPMDEWIRMVSIDQVSIQSEDQLNLKSYRINNEQNTDKWVIVAHGYTSSSNYMMETAREFYDLGFHVLTPDARGHGDSEGDYFGMGWHERRDMVKWVEWILEQDPDAQIVLYGVSMGGATVMMTSGEELPTNVKAIVEDCGYTSVKEEFTYQLKQIFKLPAFPVLNFASLVTKIRAGYTLGEADAIKQLEKTDIPILFIHGDQDTFVPPKMVEEAFAAAASEKEMFIVEDAGHGMSAVLMGREYWNRVDQFISRYLD